ncbi:MAG: hypothetical protein ACRDRX_28085 [Pseudonocardiaceae bacterium]
MSAEPEMLWALCAADKRIHAVVIGDVESLCGVPLPEGDAGLSRPWGDLCLPCVIGATADLPDPGPGGAF